MKKFIDKIKDQLTCNSNDSENPTFDYTNKQVDDNIDYFTKCESEGLSPYKSLLFFHFHLNEK